MSGEVPPVRVWLRVRMPLIWLCALVVATVAAFAAVRSSFQRTAPDRPDWQSIERAQTFERFANDLDALLLELDRARPPASPGERALWETWIRDSYRPRVAEFYRLLLNAPLQGPPYDALLTAADRLSAAAANPGDERTLSSARDARDRMQAAIRAEIARVNSR